ncbi:MAG TPA: 4-hydroxy-tetrahydrodipicolinate reductase [Bacillota bacterium]|nr:4-hydroxy-tetrahydrodipicolinate reductase [Bacillota bacterium]HPT87951.1 4-hydroxy-tetrahydrodipicolinate reductase [Bacillota bacterium]
MEKIRVLVSGCCGRMGQEVVKMVLKDVQLQLVGAVDQGQIGKDIGEVVGADATGILVEGSLTEAIANRRPQVMVDFTTPAAVMDNIRTAIGAGVHVVVGTTGISQNDLEEIRKLCETHRANALIAPNFAVGALLMMRFAAMAAKYFSQVEIIELHHDRKLDAPSGTSIKTAEMILAARGEAAERCVGEEKIKGVRGGEMNGVHLHSVRLPGLIAHQEVIFGGEGQILTIRHDSLSRESFMPGVALAVKKIMGRPGLTYGLEHFLFE